MYRTLSAFWTSMLIRYSKRERVQFMHAHSGKQQPLTASDCCTHHQLLSCHHAPFDTLHFPLGDPVIAILAGMTLQGACLASSGVLYCAYVTVGLALS